MPTSWKKVTPPILLIFPWKMCSMYPHLWADFTKRLAAAWILGGVHTMISYQILRHTMLYVFCLEKEKIWKVTLEYPIHSDLKFSKLESHWYTQPGLRIKFCYHPSGDLQVNVNKARRLMEIVWHTYSTHTHTHIHLLQYKMHFTGLSHFYQILWTLDHMVSGKHVHGLEFPWLFNFAILNEKALFTRRISIKNT